DQLYEKPLLRSRVRGFSFSDTPVRCVFRAVRASYVSWMALLRHAVNKILPCRLVDDIPVIKRSHPGHPRHSASNFCTADGLKAFSFPLRSLSALLMSSFQQRRSSLAVWGAGLCRPSVFRDENREPTGKYSRRVGTALHPSEPC